METEFHQKLGLPPRFQTHYSLSHPKTCLRPDSQGGAPASLEVPNRKQGTSISGAIATDGAYINPRLVQKVLRCQQVNQRRCETPIVRMGDFDNCVQRILPDQVDMKVPELEQNRLGSSVFERMAADLDRMSVGSHKESGYHSGDSDQVSAMSDTADFSRLPVWTDGATCSGIDLQGGAFPVTPDGQCEYYFVQADTLMDQFAEQEQCGNVDEALHLLNQAIDFFHQATSVIGASSENLQRIRTKYNTAQLRRRRLLKQAGILPPSTGRRRCLPSLPPDGVEKPRNGNVEGRIRRPAPVFPNDCVRGMKQLPAKSCENSCSRQSSCGANGTTSVCNAGWKNDEVSLSTDPSLLPTSDEHCATLTKTGSSGRGGGSLVVGGSEQLAVPKDTWAELRPALQRQTHVSRGQEASLNNNICIKYCAPSDCHVDRPSGRVGGGTRSGTPLPVNARTTMQNRSRELSGYKGRWSHDPGLRDLKSTGIARISASPVVSRRPQQF